MREHQKAWVSKVSGFHLASRSWAKSLHFTRDRKELAAWYRQDHGCTWCSRDRHGLCPWHGQPSLWYLLEPRSFISYTVTSAFVWVSLQSLDLPVAFPFMLEQTSSAFYTLSDRTVLLGVKKDIGLYATESNSSIEAKMIKLPIYCTKRPLFQIILLN
jgi:hypothetical protein